MGSGKNGEWTFLDLINLVSFVIGLENLELNVSQDDLQKESERLDKSMRENVEEIHRHLEVQDRKLNQIMELLDGRSIQ